MVSIFQPPTRTTKTIIMRSYLLVVQSLLLRSALSLDPNKNNRVTRKRIIDNDENENDIGRRYLESLWESVEGKSETELEPGRFRYLESMMSMAMSFPTEAPTQKMIPTKQPAPVVPSAPTITPLPTLKQPSLPPIKGPTLPTREPIPTKAPFTTPSADTPVEIPTLPPTPIVSSRPTPPCLEEEKEDFLLEIVSRITDKSIFLDIDTPQGMAYSFLLEDVPSFVCTPTVLQRYGLSTFYFATDGAKWTNNDGWLEPTQECDWFGVECNDSLFSIGLSLGERRRSILWTIKTAFVQVFHGVYAYHYSNVIVFVFVLSSCY
jgi:hypothetical protein